jgi:hypothetical protein
MLEAKGCKRAGGLADSALNRMQAKAAVGDMRRTQALASRQQVLNASRNQGAERDLKRQRAEV